MSMKSKVAVVTGAGSGIGKAAALLLAAEGARVAALGRTADELNETVSAIEKAGGEAMAVLTDVSKVAEVVSAYREVVGRWGRIDVVFANAGVNGVQAPVEELADDEWDSTLAINLTGTFLTIKYAVPQLKRHGGSVVVTASVNGNRIFSNYGATAYAVTKAGQVALTKMLALELAPHRIRLNVICPGAIETEIPDNTESRNLDTIKYPREFPKGKIPLTGGKPGTADQVAQLVLFLASDASSHITGTEIYIDGAESLFQG